MASAPLTAGSEYTLTDRDAWHAVRPLETPVDSVMVLMQQWVSTLSPSGQR